MPCKDMQICYLGLLGSVVGIIIFACAEITAELCRNAADAFSWLFSKEVPVGVEIFSTLQKWIKPKNTICVGKTILIFLFQMIFLSILSPTLCNDCNSPMTEQDHNPSHHTQHICRTLNLRMWYDVLVSHYTQLGVPNSIHLSWYCNNMFAL